MSVRWPDGPSLSGVALHHPPTLLLGGRCVRSAFFTPTTWGEGGCLTLKGSTNIRHSCFGGRNNFTAEVKPVLLSKASEAWLVYDSL